MIKKKLVAWCDFVVPTGFGNVAKNLFSGLNLKYDVHVAAINYRGDIKYDTNKWFVYPVQGDDFLNKRMLFKLVREVQPDIILLFQDSFNISSVIDEVKKLSPKSKIVSYFPVDAAYYSPVWDNVLLLSDIVITYTEWAKSVIEEFSNVSKEIHVLPHGVDLNIFKPLNMDLINSLKKQLHWENKLVFCNVNKFQSRKAIPLSVRAYSLFTKGYKICKCGNWYPIHLNKCDLNGCGEDNVESVVPTKTNNDTYYYLHMNGDERNMVSIPTDTLQNHLIMSGFTEKDYSNIIGINSINLYNTLVNEQTINQIYNVADYNINLGLGEGFGLSLAESMAAGVPSIAANNSAMPEVLQNTGILIPNITVYAKDHDNAFMRPIIDIREAVKAFEKVYTEWVGRGKQKVIDMNCVNTAKKCYAWADKRNILHKLLNRLF